MFRKGSDSASSRRKKSVDFEVDSETLEHEIDTWVTSNRPKLGEVLLELGSIDPDDLLDALQHQNENPTGEGAARLGNILLKLGKIDEGHLAAALAHQFGIPFIDLTEETPQKDATQLVGEELARKHSVVPLRIDDEGRVYLAVADPLDTDAIEELTQRCKRIGIVMGARSQIERLLEDAYNVLDTATEHIRAFELTAADEISKGDDESFAVDENAPIVQVANRIITQAVRNRASDVHVEPGEKAVRVRYRVDGAMTEAITLPANMASALVSRFKVMSGLNIVERRRPQDGQFGVGVDGRPIDIRISTVPTIHGEKVVMRLLDKTKSLISLKGLGMHPQVEDEYLKIVTAPLGMLLCTGPTGSGKTTTLYATLAEINDPTRNVVTIEDPVEYQFEGITQMPISGTGTSFADGLRGILRQDPDIILVGEIRDEETARIAMQASLTGHFVLSSLHAVDSVAAVHRFTDMGLEPFLVASSLTGVVGQRLLRRICSNCKTEYTPTAREVTIVDEFVGHQPTEWVKGAGCNMCSNTGFRGRVGVYELLSVSDTIREMIVERASHHELRAVAIDEGMRTMQMQAFELVVNGITTVEDVVRSVYAPGVGESEESQLELPAGRRSLRRAKQSLRDAREREQAAEDNVDETAKAPIEMGETAGPAQGDASQGAGTTATEGKATVPTAPPPSGDGRIIKDSAASASRPGPVPRNGTAHGTGGVDGDEDQSEKDDAKVGS
ncbi:MAG: Flp pilus assembly complex ATPase component TadA [Microthrixaceae bacterium]|nr:Flp pilus assembly complex ATPase component TadA [Microthrixaceae bacterium]